jgi:hypothetical protein
LLVPPGSRTRLAGRIPKATLVEVGTLGDAITAMRRAGLIPIR